MQAKDYIGKRMMFTGADDNQAKWTGNADPRSFFGEVNFLIDPFIADLPCYIDRNDNETVEI